jgi:hypothetical protein
MYLYILATVITFISVLFMVGMIWCVGVFITWMRYRR